MPLIKRTLFAADNLRVQPPMFAASQAAPRDKSAAASRDLHSNHEISAKRCREGRQLWLTQACWLPDLASQIGHHLSGLITSHQNQDERQTEDDVSSIRALHGRCRAAYIEGGQGPVAIAAAMAFAPTVA
jgi:hypothetical protein